MNSKTLCCVRLFFCSCYPLVIALVVALVAFVILSITTSQNQLILLYPQANEPVRIGQTIKIQATSLPLIVGQIICLWAEFRWVRLKYNGGEGEAIQDFEITQEAFGVSTLNTTITKDSEQICYIPKKQILGYPVYNCVKFLDRGMYDLSPSTVVIKDSQVVQYDPVAASLLLLSAAPSIIKGSIVLCSELSIVVEVIEEPEIHNDTMHLKINETSLYAAFSYLKMENRVSQAEADNYNSFDFALDQPISSKTVGPVTLSNIVISGNLHVGSVYYRVLVDKYTLQELEFQIDACWVEVKLQADLEVVLSKTKSISFSLLKKPIGKILKRLPIPLKLLPILNVNLEFSLEKDFNLEKMYIQAHAQMNSQRIKYLRGSLPEFSQDGAFSKVESSLGTSSSSCEQHLKVELELGVQFSDTLGAISASLTYEPTLFIDNNPWPLKEKTVHGIPISINCDCLPGEKINSMRSNVMESHFVLGLELLEISWSAELTRPIPQLINPMHCENRLCDSMCKAGYRCAKTGASKDERCVLDQEGGYETMEQCQQECLYYQCVNSPSGGGMCIKSEKSTHVSLESCERDCMCSHCDNPYCCRCPGRHCDSDYAQCLAKCLYTPYFLTCCDSEAFANYTKH